MEIATKIRIVNRPIFVDPTTAGPSLKKVNYLSRKRSLLDSYFLFHSSLVTRCRRPLILQTINSVRSNSLCLKKIKGLQSNVD